MPRYLLLFGFTTLAAGLSTGGLKADDDKSGRSLQARVFRKRIRPLLAENCYQCHGPEKQRNGLRLDSRAAILTGGDRGPAIVAGEPGASRLIQAVRHSDEPRMPPKGKLSEAQIADLVAWVKMGAAGAIGEGKTSRRPCDRMTPTTLPSAAGIGRISPFDRPRRRRLRMRRGALRRSMASSCARLERAGLAPRRRPTSGTLIRRVTST